MPRLLSHDPSSPRNRPRPSASPLASSLPFDWDAAIHHKPPPYSTPTLQRKLRKRSSIGVNATPGSSHSTPLKSGGNAKRVYRKVPIQERIMNWMSQIIYDIQDFPRDRMPDPRAFARTVGVGLHIIHLIVRYSKLRRVKDEDIGWEDMLGEIDIPGAPSVGSWFDWTTPAAVVLIIASILNTVYLFTRIKIYHLFNRTDLAASPSAELINSDGLDRIEHQELPSIMSRITIQFAHIFWSTWHLLMGTTPTAPRTGLFRKVQRLSVWAPDEGGMLLFIIYSPLHALLWQAVSPGNWILIIILLGITSVQLWTLQQRYAILLKDKDIVAAEVLHEYDEKFVFPHIMRVRRDVGVMTHEAEVISFR